jgi:hypothetical protein
MCYTIFADTNYTVVCNATNFPNGVIQALHTSIGAASTGYTLLNRGGGTAASSATIECIAMHDFA